ncbi:hypothetical protein F385_3686 [Pantoea agglomerans 299R]|nr:hypothetical protein F385_3686 [Pantoea agglomerans 299R]
MRKRSSEQIHNAARLTGDSADTESRVAPVLVGALLDFARLFRAATAASGGANPSILEFY